MTALPCGCDTIAYGWNPRDTSPLDRTLHRIKFCPMHDSSRLMLRTLERLRRRKAGQPLASKDIIAIERAIAAARGRDDTEGRHPSAKLTRRQVIEIRRRHAAGEITSWNATAQEFGIAWSTLQKVITHQTWRGIG